MIETHALLWTDTSGVNHAKVDHLTALEVELAWFLRFRDYTNPRIVRVRIVEVEESDVEGAAV